LGEFEQVVGALGQRLPGRDLVAQPLSLTQNLLRAALVGPEIGRARRAVELVEARLLGG